MDLTNSAVLLDSLAKLAGAGILIWGVAWSVAKWIFRPLRSWFNKIFVEDRQKLDFIVGELKPNGGGSLRDYISSIKDSVIRTEVWQKTRLSHEHLPYFDTDAQGRVTWVNKSLMRLLNASESDVIGYGLKNFIYIKDKHKLTEDWDTAIKNSIDLITHFRIKDSAGQIRCMECSALAVRGGVKNEIIGYTGVLIEKELNSCIDSDS